MRRETCQSPMTCLARANVETKRARVIVLEEVQGKAAGSRELKADSAVGWALVGADDVRVARLQAADGAVLRSLRWLIGVGGALVGDAGENVRNETALSVELVRASLKLAQLREEEDKRACLSGVRCRNVKVEDAGNSAVDGSVVGSAIGGVWRA